MSIDPAGGQLELERTPGFSRTGLPSHTGVVEPPVDYTPIAPRFERRYQEHDYSGVTQALRAFVAASTPEASPLVLEVGAGTGHWLQVLRDSTPSRTVGLDLSEAMLNVARAAHPEQPLVRARGEALPVANGCFDAVICINAVHHFANPEAFISEARRVLKPGGGLFIVGLDPHAGVDTWWLYDAFPDARDADLRRYPSSSAIRNWMTQAGFEACGSEVVHRWTYDLTGEALRTRGLLERSGTSQLLVIPDEAYARGVALIDAEPEAVRRTHLHLFATVGTAA